jgi:hypothetical protein
MPITPNIIQTMKQTVKARVLTISTERAWRLGLLAGVEVEPNVSMAMAMNHSFSLHTNVGVRACGEHPSVGYAGCSGRTSPAAAGIVMKE